MNRLAILCATAGLALSTTQLAAQTAPALNYVQPLSPAAVQSVQQQLQQQGAYSGQVDGVWGPDSAGALSAFQQQHGLQVTGQMNQATAVMLGLQPGQLLGGGAPPPPPPPPGPTTLSRRAVVTLQQRLQGLGYYTGAIDGAWGPGAQEALRRFQQASGIQVTGQINAQTVTAMGLDPQTITSQ